MKAKGCFRFLMVLFAFFSFGLTGLAEELNIPSPIGDIYVQDFAHVLDASQKAELLNLGKTIEDQTTAQVVVLTVQTIGDRTIEEYANEAYRQYGIGSKEEDNGVLLVLAMGERKIRIEVGYGLEGRIPDGKAGRIIDEFTIPYLTNQQPDLAVVKTYKALSEEVLAEYSEQNQQQTLEQAIKKPLNWFIVLLVLIGIFLDFKFFGGTITYFALSILSKGRIGGGRRGGGGGSSGGGGASRGW